MKITYVLLATAGLAAAQQSFTDVVPACSKDCLVDAVKNGTPCTSPQDSKCICEATNYRNIYTVGVSCVLAACGSDVATGQLLPAAAKFCREVTGGASAPPVQSASAAGSSVVPKVTATPTSAAAPVASTTHAGAAAGAAPRRVVGMLALGALAMF